MIDYRNILVLDDDNITTLLLQNTLKKSFNIHILNDSTVDIVSYLTTNEISLVLLDIDMPFRSGFEVADIIKSDDTTKDIPIIFLTATNDKSFLVKAFDNEAVDYVQKPFNTLELKARINTHLSNYIYLEKIKKQQDTIYAQAMSSGMNEILMNISHHWRQPLSIISLSAQTINIENELGTISKNEVNNLCKDITKIVKELSDNIDFFSNTYANENILEELFIPEDFDVLIDVLNNLFKEDLLEIIVENKIKESMTIKLNVSALKIVIIKIVTNSIEAYNLFDMTNKKLHIKISTVDNKLEILLKDFAGGIENKNIQKIFEPYYSTKKNLNGSGLGLFVSRNIIRQQFNGELNIENHKDKDNKGAIAQIIIPL